MIVVVSNSTYTDDYKKLITRVKQVRLDAGFSQQVVADKLGKPQSYMSKVESCERRIDVIELKAILSVYGKQITDIA